MTEPYVTITKSLVCSTRISATAMRLLLMLEIHRNKKTGQCNPKVRSLAAELGMGERSVRRDLAELRETGFIVEQKHGQRSDSYVIARVLEWPTLASLKIFRQDKFGRVKHDKCGKSDGSPSLYEKKPSEKEASAPAASRDSDCHRPPKPTAATTATKNSSSNNATKNGVHGLALRDELLEQHPEKGNPKKALPVICSILAASADPVATAAAIRASHRAWRDEWDAKLAHRPQAFIPQLWSWFESEEYLHPPSPTDTEARRRQATVPHKSRLEEMLDNA